MKTASIPSLRVEPALRQAAEAVLQEGESLSSFLETSLRAQVTERQLQQAFIARGLTSRDNARRTGIYHSADDVLQSLRDQLRHAVREDRG